MRPFILKNIIYYNLQKKLYKLIIIILLNISTNNLNANNYLFEKGHLVLDLKNNIYWLRCSVGQIWDNSQCQGKAIKLTMKEVMLAKKIAKRDLGGNWRLPTRKELESIVCKTCTKSKIDAKFFPNTPYEPFWTGEKNGWSKRFYWSVNFFTGHTFGRFPGKIPNFVRLVKEK